MPQIPIKEEVRAHMKLRELGSVMARDEKPEWRRKLTPLMGTVLDVLDSVLSFGPSPLDASGGKGMATLPSLMWLKKLKDKISPTIPTKGYVHGAPLSTVKKYIKEGIPLGSTEEGLHLGFVGRLDHPQGYEASMTAVGGFGPRTIASQAYEAQAQVGRERFRESVAYILDETVEAYPRHAWESIADFVESHPTYQKAFQGKDVISYKDEDIVLAQIRPDLKKWLKERKLKQLRSHRTDPEAIIGRETAAQIATPQQIIGLVYDGPLTKIIAMLKESGRELPIYGPDGNLRYYPKN